MPAALPGFEPSPETLAGRNADIYFLRSRQVPGARGAESRSGDGGLRPPPGPAVRHARGGGPGAAGFGGGSGCLCRAPAGGQLVRAGRGGAAHRRSLPRLRPLRDGPARDPGQRDGMGHGRGRLRRRGRGRARGPLRGPPRPSRREPPSGVRRGRRRLQRLRHPGRRRPLGPGGDGHPAPRPGAALRGHPRSGSRLRPAHRSGGGAHRPGGHLPRRGRGERPGRRGNGGPAVGGASSTRRRSWAGSRPIW